METEEFKIAEIKTKCCTTCKTFKPEDQFGLRSATKKYGGFGKWRKSSCKSCCAEYAIEYRKNQDKAAQAKYDREYEKANRDKRNAKKVRWAKNNKEKVSLYQRVWREKNKEISRGYVRAWAEKNPHVAALKREKTKLATPKWVRKDEILLFYKSAKALTRETGTSHHVDHIVPLVSNFVCGLHVPWNLRVVTAMENQSKSNRLNPCDVVVYWDFILEGQS